MAVHPALQKSSAAFADGTCVAHGVVNSDFVQTHGVAPKDLIVRWSLAQDCALADKCSKLKTLRCRLQPQTECTMTFIDSSNQSEPSTLTPQKRHYNAAERSEKAAKHHRTAALLHDSGDHEQAKIYAKFARKHTVAALMACSGESDH
jgi:hypothetical protein